MKAASISRILRALGWAGRSPRREWSPGASWTARIVGEQERPAFHHFRASSRRSFLPHRMHFLRKAGPDAVRLAEQMAGIRRPDALWEIVLHAEEGALRDVPEDLFFDPEIVWHQQHLGMPGHVAYACLAEEGETLYGLNYVSDAAQRVSRRPDVRSRVENALSGWPDLLVNAVLHFAVERGCRELRSPTASHVIEHTDPAREVGRELFERVYDRTIAGTLTAAETPDWWVADVAGNADRRVPARPVRQSFGDDPRICVFHDVERGLGHRREDPDFARRADRIAPDALDRMLRIERELGVTATYNVVGRILPDVRPRIEKKGHSLAFHSFDHDVREAQLERCREVDYRLPGYRPPMSRMTRELADRSLGWHNFQWFAVAGEELEEEVPYLENRIVKIPVLADDFALYRDGIAVEQWAGEVLSRVERRSFSAIGLHDCYGEYWLPVYRRLLESLRSVGELVTLDRIANEVFLQTSI